MSNENNRMRETTKGWEVCIKWNDGSSNWNQVKDVRESLPIQITDYAVLHQIADKPEFEWWIKKVLKKGDRIVSKTAIKYWKRCTSTDCAYHIRSRKPLI